MSSKTVMSDGRFEPAMQPPRTYVLNPCAALYQDPVMPLGWQYQHLLCLLRARGFRFIGATC